MPCLFGWGAVAGAAAASVRVVVGRRGCPSRHAAPWVLLPWLHPRGGLLGWQRGSLGHDTALEEGVQPPASLVFCNVCLCKACGLTSHGGLNSRAESNAKPVILPAWRWSFLAWPPLGLSCPTGSSFHAGARCAAPLLLSARRKDPRTPQHQPQGRNKAAAWHSGRTGGHAWPPAPRLCSQWGRPAWP